MKNLSDKFEKQIRYFVLDRYKINPDIKELCWDLTKIATYHNSFPGINKNGVPYKLLTKWYRTTRIKGDMTAHSCHGFAEYLDKHYILMPIKKNKWYTNMVYHIIKLIKI